MRERHQKLIEEYPNQLQAKGPAFTGISNARPETNNLKKLYGSY